MAIRKELIDELIATSGGSLIGPNGLVKELTKALVERMLAGEMNHHLGYEKHDPPHTIKMLNPGENGQIVLSCQSGNPDIIAWYRRSLRF